MMQMSGKGIFSRTGVPPVIGLKSREINSPWFIMDRQDACPTEDLRMSLQ